MFTSKEDGRGSHGVQESQVDVRLKKLCQNEEELVTENTVAEVEYQPKGYLKVLKTTLQGEIGPRQ